MADNVFIVRQKPPVQEEVEVLVDKKTFLPYCEVRGKGQRTKQFHAAGSPGAEAPSNSRRGSPRQYIPSHISFDTKARPAQLNSLGHLEPKNSLFKPKTLNSVNLSPSPYLLPRAPPQYSPNFNSSDNYNSHLDPDSEMENYRHESDLMQREIDDLLEGKKNLKNYDPSDISTSLKQVLRGLEGFKKKVKAMEEENENNEIEDESPVDLKGLTRDVIGAFEKAQKKTATKVIGYTKTRAEQAVGKREMGTMVKFKIIMVLIFVKPDPEILEAERNSYRKDLEKALEQSMEELSRTKKKMKLIEQDRNSLHDKYAKIALEHSRCEQTHKELQIKMNSTEKEHDNAKQLIEEVKRGKVDRLFLSKEQEDIVKKNIQQTQNPDHVAQ